MLIVGEVHTGLLRGRDPVAGDVARDLVDLVSGESVLVSERPRSSVRSPSKPVGVDCPLDPGGPGRQVRGVGTVIQRAAITDGHLLQGSAYASFDQAAQSGRQPWSHYLSRPGVVETIGRTRWDELAASFAAARPAGAALDLGGIAARAADQVQRSVRDGGRPRLRAARTRLRWIAEIAPSSEESPAGVRFAIHSAAGSSAAGSSAAGSSAAGSSAAGSSAAGSSAAGSSPAGNSAAGNSAAGSSAARNSAAGNGVAAHGDEVRVLRFRASPEATPERLAEVAEDVALHDWLLTALLEIMRKAAIGVLPREEAIGRLLPAIDHLLHLWLPGARGDALSDRVWAALESRAGLSRHWALLVNRIRDQLAVAGLHPVVGR